MCGLRILLAGLAQNIMFGALAMRREPTHRAARERRLAAAITRWEHAPEHPTCAHVGLLVLRTLAMEPAAAARDLATESCIGGVVPGIGSRSPRNP
jgi:hypothetical protein